jgi:hypothetical protein
MSRQGSFVPAWNGGRLERCRPVSSISSASAAGRFVAASWVIARGRRKSWDSEGKKQCSAAYDDRDDDQCFQSQPEVSD